MRPYYERGDIWLFLGDARDVLPTLPPVELLLTDPPYPGLKGGEFTRNSGVAPRNVPTKTVGEPWGDDISALSLAKFTKGAMVFCSHHFVCDVPALIDAIPLCLVSWYQRNTMPRLANVPWFRGEFIWTFRATPGLDWKRLETVYDIPRLSAGCVSTGERFTDEEGKVFHPAQKPLELISRLLDVSPASVCDPYAGTGTTLLACWRRGIKCVGVELSERYCELAARRLEAEPTPLFIPELLEPPRQEALDL